MVSVSNESEEDCCELAGRGSTEQMDLKGKCAAEVD